MSPPLTRTEALRVLELPASADAGTVKRAYRRLAREHHPDRGGDPATFHRLQQAYERLAEDDDRPEPPQVSRGRPSRPAGGPDGDGITVDLGSIDWDVSCPDGEVPLSRDRLAILLARDHTGPVHPVTAASRAPGSRLNRLAVMLAGDLTSRLSIGPGTDDRRRPVVTVDLRGSTRRARRALDRVALGPLWTRTRTSSSTLLRSTLTPRDDRRVTSVCATDRVEGLLGELDWPLGAWTVMLERQVS